MRKTRWLLALALVAAVVPLAAAFGALAQKNGADLELLAAGMQATAVTTTPPANALAAAGTPAAEAGDPAREACARDWLAAQVAAPEAQTGAYGRLLACRPEYLEMIYYERPLDQALAQEAVRRYPESGRAWLWLGEVQQAAHLPEAVDSYLMVVGLDPEDGLAWCRLGFAYEGLDAFPPARDAYLECCDNGDPGSNGCYRAGRMEEKLGNPRQAVLDYRRSNWEPAQKLADALEETLK